MVVIVDMEILFFNSVGGIHLALQLKFVAGVDVLPKSLTDMFTHWRRHYVRNMLHKEGRFEVSAGCQSVWTIPSGH